MIKNLLKRLLDKYLVVEIRKATKVRWTGKSSWDNEGAHNFIEVKIHFGGKVVAEDWEWLD